MMMTMISLCCESLALSFERNITLPTTPTPGLVKRMRRKVEWMINVVERVGRVVEQRMNLALNAERVLKAGQCCARSGDEGVYKCQRHGKKKPGTKYAAYTVRIFANGSQANGDISINNSWEKHYPSYHVLNLLFDKDRFDVQTKCATRGSHLVIRRGGTPSLSLCLTPRMLVTGMLVILDMGSLFIQDNDGGTTMVICC